MLREIATLPSDLCDDATFLRRIYLDLTGKPPSRKDVRTFLVDRREQGHVPTIVGEFGDQHLGGPGDREAGLLDEFDLLFAMKNTGIGGFVLYDRAVYKYNLWHFVHKKNKHLIPKLTAVLQRLHKSGKIETIKSGVLKELKSATTTIKDGETLSTRY